MRIFARASHAQYQKLAYLGIVLGLFVRWSADPDRYLFLVTCCTAGSTRGGLLKWDQGQTEVWRGKEYEGGWSWALSEEQG